jgi:hypothetical protein
MRSWIAACCSCSLAGLIVTCAGADEIKVAPGPGAIAAALAKAKEGDVVKIAAGEYSESVEVPGGVTLEGAGADTTILTATAYAAINCRGPHVRISGLTIKPAEATVRGINTSLPVRVERCRVVGVKEGVALMSAPLSDVVACEFVDCGIGVRAIGGACPTVWGCVFKGGGMGVFSMDGSPYIRNNLFNGTKDGIRMMSHQIQQPIIRNNVFLKCSGAGIELLPNREAMFGPSIRNSVFVECGAAMVGDKAPLSNVSHSVVHGVAAPALRTKDGAEAIALDAAAIVDPGISVDDANKVSVAHAELVDAKGVRTCMEPQGTTGTIGLEKDWRQVGVNATATLPPVRFGGKRLIANSVGEEYQYLQVLKRPRSKQSVGSDGGVKVDMHTPGDGKAPATIKFEIDRFFAESSIK